MRREREPSADARPASKPAHTSSLIGYTTTRDEITSRESNKVT
jgi:hypothetical protein